MDPTVVAHHLMLERRRVVIGRTGPDHPSGLRARGVTGAGQRGQRVAGLLRAARRLRAGIGAWDKNDLWSVHGAEPDPDLLTTRGDVDIAHPPAITPQAVGAGVAYQPAVGTRLQDQMPAGHAPVDNDDVGLTRPPDHVRSTTRKDNLTVRGVDLQRGPIHLRISPRGRRLVATGPVATGVLRRSDHNCRIRTESGVSTERTD